MYCARYCHHQASLSPTQRCWSCRGPGEKVSSTQAMTTTADDTASYSRLGSDYATFSASHLRALPRYAITEDGVFAQSAPRRAASWAAGYLKHISPALAITSVRVRTQVGRETPPRVQYRAAHPHHTSKNHLVLAGKGYRQSDIPDAGQHMYEPHACSLTREYLGRFGQLHHVRCKRDARLRYVRSAIFVAGRLVRRDSEHLLPRGRGSHPGAPQMS